MTEDPRIEGFVKRVAEYGAAHFREFPWRETMDPYAILVSEVMLQQTQVARVVPYYRRWLESFPTIEALAGAPLEAVLRMWQGLGYNRRAIALTRLAEELVARADGRVACLPREDAALRALPGVGPATAAGVRAFAFNEPAAYLETNVRAVVLHEFFADAVDVHDRQLAPIVEQAAAHAHATGIDARVWNYALLDYGAHLKRAVPNPSRRSAHHARQSTFEGSRRQFRARLLRVVMELPGIASEAAAEGLGMSHELAEEILGALHSEGFIVEDHGGWTVR